MYKSQEMGETEEHTGNPELEDNILTPFVPELVSQAAARRTDRHLLTKAAVLFDEVQGLQSELIALINASPKRDQEPQKQLDSIYKLDYSGTRAWDFVQSLIATMAYDFNDYPQLALIMQESHRITEHSQRSS